MENLKPSLACDVDLNKLRFPLMASPKIDGVRGINLNGTMTGRSLKPHGNKYVVSQFSGEHTIGFDGELALTGQETSPSLCRDTTSAVRSEDGEPDVTWWLFDYITEQTVLLTYEQRFAMMAEMVKTFPHRYPKCRVMPARYVDSLTELLNFENECLDDGYEGVILRDPKGMHKSGRATVKGGSYLRIKRFIDFEGEIVSFEEAMENTNEAKTNALGRTERSTARAGLVAKGMVGNITLRALKDVEWSGKVLIAKDQLVVVGPGKMLHEDRVKYFQQPELFIGQVAKSKFFPHGQKDKPRFPVFMTLRSLEDMSE